MVIFFYYRYRHVTSGQKQSIQSFLREREKGPVEKGQDVNFAIDIVGVTGDGYLVEPC